MDFVGLAIAAFNFLSSIFGLGHIGTLCASSPALALHFGGQSGLEVAQATLRSALTGTPTC
jgi:hypothetical protein